MRFSSEYAQEIIAQALVFQAKFSERPAANTVRVLVYIFIHFFCEHFRDIAA